VLYRAVIGIVVDALSFVMEVYILRSLVPRRKKGVGSLCATNATIAAAMVAVLYS
jgi:hypothetical protein